MVVAGIEALKAVWHRGAVDADGMTGDGAGIHVDLPERFFDDAIAASGHKVLPNRLAVGMIFLPRTDLNAQEECRTIVEAEIIDAGFTIYGWRQVPVDTAVIGEKAAATRPEIEQIVIAAEGGDEARSLLCVAQVEHLQRPRPGGKHRRLEPAQREPARLHAGGVAEAAHRARSGQAQGASHGPQATGRVGTARLPQWPV